MGGFFSGPSAPPLSPPPPVVDTAEEERKSRLEAIDRRRRGRPGTIATSERGVLSQSASPAPASTNALKEKLGD